MTIDFPGCPRRTQWRLASLIAVSFASLPPLTKKTPLRVAGARSASRSASSIAGGEETPPNVAA